MRLMLDADSAAHIYLVTDHITRIDPTSQGVRVTVDWRTAYAADKRFQPVKLNKTLAVTLEGYQIEQAAQQLRKDAPFCGNCWDYGKRPDAPADCLRCTLLANCLRAGAGDYRKVKGASTPAPTAPHRPLWMILSLFGLAYALVMICASCQQVRSEADGLREQLKRVKVPYSQKK